MLWSSLRDADKNRTLSPSSNLFSCNEVDFSTLMVCRCHRVFFLPVCRLNLVHFAQRGLKVLDMDFREPFIQVRLYN